jgi:hypothetical protein
MEVHGEDYVLVDCQCGKRLRFPRQNRALIVTCPECKRSFLWFPDRPVRRLNFATRLFRLLRERRWSSLTVAIIALASFYLGYSVARRSVADKKHTEVTSSEISTPGIPKRLDTPLLRTPSEPPSFESPLPKRISREPTTRQPTSLPSGTNITAPYGKGRSVLKVINGTLWDAIVKLVGEDGKLYRFFYVRKGESAEVKQIPAGTYYLRWCSGLDWDKDARRFRQIQGFFEAGRHLVFEEKRSERGVQYSKITVTLHEVPFGNLPKRTISEQKFNSHE